MRKEEKPTDSGCLEKTMKFPRFRELCFIFYLPFHSFAPRCRCVRFDFAIITTKKKHYANSQRDPKKKQLDTVTHCSPSEDETKMMMNFSCVCRKWKKKDITFARETLSKGIYRARIFTVFGAKRCATWLWEIVDLFFFCFALRSLLFFPLLFFFFAISRVYIWKTNSQWNSYSVWSTRGFNLFTRQPIAIALQRVCCVVFFCQIVAGRSSSWSSCDRAGRVRRPKTTSSDKPTFFSLPHITTNMRSDERSKCVYIKYSLWVRAQKKYRAVEN